MDITDDIHDLSWSAFSHDDLYRMVRTEAAGTKGMVDTDRAWAQLTLLMHRSRRNIDELLGKAGASWEGLAADAMQNSVTPLAQWTDETAAASMATGDSVRSVAEWFAFTANQMPEPVSVPSAADTGISAKYVHLFGGQTDQDQLERAAQEAKQRAVELMTAYSSVTGDALGRVGVFVAPQQVTVDVRPSRGDAGPGSHDQSAVVTPPPVVPGGAVEPGARATPDPPRDTSPDASRPEPAPEPPLDTGWPTTPGELSAPVGSTTAAVAPVADTRGSDGFTPRVGPGSAHQNGQSVGGGGVSGALPLSTPDTSARILRAAGETPPPVTRTAGLGAPLVPGAGASREEDGEHLAPDYLQAYHDEYWEGGQRVSPPVLGAEEHEG